MDPVTGNQADAEDLSTPKASSLASDTEANQARLRSVLDDYYGCLDATAEELERLEEGLGAQRLQQEKFDRAAAEYLVRCRAQMQALDDAATVMQRELSHLEALRQPGSREDVGLSIAAVSSLLTLSVRLAAGIFPPEQLRALEASDDEILRLQLSSRWQEWLEALTKYLVELVPVAGNAAALAGSDWLSDEYRATLAGLGEQLRLLAGRPPAQPVAEAGENAGREAPPHGSPCPQKGPLFRWTPLSWRGLRPKRTDGRRDDG